MATLNLTYGNQSLLRVVTVQYDDVAHSILGASVGTMPIPSGLGAGAEFYRQVVGADNYILKVSNSFPYATLTHEVNLEVGGVVVNASRFGASDGTITITPSGGSGGNTFLWDDGTTTQNRSGLPAGTYSVTVTDSAGHHVVGSFTVTEPPVLAVSETHTNVTTTGGSDGTINLAITGGSGDYSITWADSVVTTPGRIGLSAGNYTASVLDNNTGELITVNVTITEPSIVPPDPTPGTYLFVPMMNSLKFITNPIDPDNCATMPQPDNQLLINQYFPGYMQTNYFQKVQTCDAFPLQWNSDFPNHVVELLGYCDDLVKKTFSPTLVRDFINQTVTYNVTLSAYFIAGKTQIRFTPSILPIPLKIGDSVDITTNTEGMNGVYNISDLYTDSDGVQYFVINRAYLGAGSTSSAKGEFAVSAAPYNVFESALTFADVDPGKYYMRITAADTIGDTQVSISEPFDLQVLHKKSMRLRYKNFDDGYGDIVWTSGFTGLIRFESILHKRLPASEITTSRSATYSLIKLDAKAIRGFRHENWALPPYMHELLALVYNCDSWDLNAVACQSAGAYEDPTYEDRDMLGNSSIKIEQVDWMRKYNSNDIGLSAGIPSDRIYDYTFDRTYN